MWLPQSHYDKDACALAPNVPIPLAAFDTLWYYSGRGVIPQGYPDPYDEVVRVMQQSTVARAVKKFKKRPNRKTMKALTAKLRLPRTVFKGFIGIGDQDSDEEDEDDKTEEEKSSWKRDPKRIAQEFKR